MIEKLLVLAITVCGGLTLAWPLIRIQERGRRGSW
jgi:hypothetical protein